MPSLEALAEVDPKGVVGAARKLPVFSPVLTRLLSVLADENCSAATIASHIERDAVLAGHILRMVNSPLFGLPKPVQNIRHAVSMAGRGRVRDLALTISMNQMWQAMKIPAPWSSRTFHQHSVAVGILAGLIAGKLETDDTDGAFTAGLLHDLGKAILAVTLGADYLKLTQGALFGTDAFVNIEKHECGISHADLSAAILQEWNIPETIREAVRFHHDAEQAPGASRPLALALWAADWYANRTGILAIPAPGDPPQGSPTAAMEQLGLSMHIEAIIAKFKDSFDLIVHAS